MHKKSQKLHISPRKNRQFRLLSAEEKVRKKEEQLSKMFRAMQVPMNEISELMYVSDVETYDLLFINNAGKESFQIEETEGLKCYKALQGRDEPCPFCTTSFLKTDENYTWEITNDITGRHYLLKDRLIEWEGRLARLEIAFDTTEAENEKIELQNMLNSEKMVVECVSELYRNPDLAAATSSVLKQIGTFLSADRTYLLELRDDLFFNTAEWCKEGIHPQIDNLQNIPASQFQRWLSLFRTQDYVSIDDLSEISQLAPEEYAVLNAQGIERLVVVPLEYDGRLSSFIGVDNLPLNRMQNARSMLQTLRFFLMLAVRRSEAEATLAQLSYHDMLTSFYNRNRYIEDTAQLRKSAGPVGVVYLDINGMKGINDQHGHTTGDNILCECAQRIIDVFLDHGTFYRIGGDEFVIICKDIEETAFFDKVRELRLSFTKEDSLCQAAIGSQWSVSCDALESAIKAADEKMYEDKKAFYYSHRSSKRYRHYHDDILHLADLSTLRSEISRDRFVLFLQPKISVATQMPIGAEALVRYRNNKGDLVLPGEFIPLLEKLQIVSQIDFFIFESVCSQLKDWIMRGMQPLPVAVNFSRCSLFEPGFIQKLCSICEKYGIPSSLLEIEITENISGPDSSEIKLLIDQIRASGFSVAIDDFGIEFSNLSLFSTIDFDVLKIDKSLVKDIVNNSKARSVVEAMEKICSKIDIQLVAEGVEDERQLNVLKECGVNIVQGFLFSRPTSIADYESRYL